MQVFAQRRESVVHPESRTNDAPELRLLRAVEDERHARGLPGYGVRVLGASSTMMLRAGRSAAICCIRYASVSRVRGSRGARGGAVGAGRSRGFACSINSAMPAFRPVKIEVPMGDQVAIEGSSVSWNNAAPDGTCGPEPSTW